MAQYLDRSWRLAVLIQGRMAVGTARRIGSLVRGAAGDRRGNVAVLMALLLVPLVGGLGMAVEASSWLLAGRASQNAADSAVVAAANNASTTQVSSHYQYEWEAWANAKTYGFSNGANATVTVARNVACPDGTSACYSATVTKVMPIYLTRVVGFLGDTDLGGGLRGMTITSTALAEPISAISYPTCLTATGNDSSGDGVQTKGAPFSNMAGCSVSATGAGSKVDCNGQGIGGNPSVFATSTIDSACTGGIARANQSTSEYTDPYADLYKNIPCSVSGASSNCAAGGPTCGSFSGTLTLGACYSGDVAYSSPKGKASNTAVTLAGDSTNGSVVYIKNGSVNLDYLALTATNVTFVFTGASPGGFTGGGKSGSLNITGPGTSASTSPWKGVAVYQDASQASAGYTATAWSDNGNAPSVDITGLIYLPKTDVSFGGGAGGPSGTPSCYIAVYHSYDTNGTGISMTRSGCAAAGLTDLPTIKLMRAAIVQ
jgi:Flp pilus assembly protein TadG